MDQFRLRIIKNACLFGWVSILLLVCTTVVRESRLIETAELVAFLTPAVVWVFLQSALEESDN